MASQFSELDYTNSNFDADCVPDYKVAGAHCSDDDTVDLQTQVTITEIQVQIIKNIPYFLYFLHTLKNHVFWDPFRIYSSSEQK